MADNSDNSLTSFFDSPEMQGVRDAWQEAEDARLFGIANHPDNGKSGRWHVTGIRHSAHVKASCAQGAIDKAHAANLVDSSWEFPEARFIGAELPDAF